MIKKLLDNFKKGAEKIKWFSALFSERVKIEIALIRLIYQSDEMNRKRDELLIKIGQRVVELRENTEKNILKDRSVAEYMVEIDVIEKNINELRQKVSEISRVAE